MYVPHDQRSPILTPPNEHRIEKTSVNNAWAKWAVKEIALQIYCREIEGRPISKDDPLFLPTQGIDAQGSYLYYAANTIFKLDKESLRGSCLRSGYSSTELSTPQKIMNLFFSNKPRNIFESAFSNLNHEQTTMSLPDRYLAALHLYHKMKRVIMQTELTAEKTKCVATFNHALKLVTEAYHAERRLYEGSSFVVLGLQLMHSGFLSQVSVENTKHDQHNETLATEPPRP